jgi:hypothetical protein
MILRGATCVNASSSAQDRLADRRADRVEGETIDSLDGLCRPPSVWAEGQALLDGRAPRVALADNGGRDGGGRPSFATAFIET